MAKVNRKHSNTCTNCQGVGWKEMSCSSCGGSGERNGKRCHPCRGNGRVQVNCATCLGTGTIDV